MRVHEEKHPLAGMVVKLKNGQLYAVEDWADRVLGRSVWIADGNPAALKYAIRSAMSGFPIDNNLLYGKIGMFGEIVHESEIEKAC